MAKNVTGTWALPTTRQQGGPLPIEEIQRTLVEMSADGGANFVDLVNVGPTDAQQFFIPDLEQGAYVFRFTVFDTAGQAGTVHTERVEVADDSPPGPITNVTISQD